jgi:hypothetical protein
MNFRRFWRKSGKPQPSAKHRKIDREPKSKSARWLRPLGGKTGGKSDFVAPTLLLPLLDLTQNALDSTISHDMEM